MYPMSKSTLDSSKDELLPSSAPATTSFSNAKKSSKWQSLACVILGSLALLHTVDRAGLLPLDLSSSLFDSERAAALCPQEGALYPVKEQAVFEKLAEHYGTEEFKARAIDWVSGSSACLDGYRATG